MIKHVGRAKVRHGLVGLPGVRGEGLLLNCATEDDQEGRCASFGFTHSTLSHGWKCEVGKAELSVHK